MKIPFTYLAGAVEATKGTPVTPPTFYTNLAGELVPKFEYMRPDESAGVRARFTRKKAIRNWGEFSANGPLDAQVFFTFASMAVRGNVTPSTPTSATLSRLWEFVPLMTSDNWKTATVFFGDPSLTNVLRGAYGFLKSLSVSQSAREGVTLTVSGESYLPTKVVAPTMPSQLFGSLVAGVNTALYLDTSSAIGTTLISSRLVSSEWSYDTGREARWLSQGPAGNKAFTDVVGAKSGVDLTFVLTMPDYTQYDLAAAGGQVVKARVRHHGDLIESGGGTDFYQYVEFDVYGVLEFTGFTDLQGAEKGAQFKIESQLDATLGADFRVAVQNTQAALP